MTNPNHYPKKNCHHRARYAPFMQKLNTLDHAQKRLFIFGHGYVGEGVARYLQENGWQIGTTSRDIKRCEILRAKGLDAYHFDTQTGMENLETALASYPFILSTIAPSQGDDPVLKTFRRAIINASEKQQGFRWIGYLSTTGVYGDRQGGWVDETSPEIKAGPKGEARKLAESAWMSLADATKVPMRVHCFRLAGIYGPGQSALNRVQQGRAHRVVKKGQVFNRIHLDDIIQILLASMAKPNAGGIYNCADDLPCPPQDVITYACHLLAVTPPPLIDFETANLSPSARSYYSENKRIDNARIKTELGVRLIWSDYRDALDALFAAQVNPD